MKSTLPLLTASVALLIARVSAAEASNWPAWRGSTGAASNARPPTTWSDSQNIKWKTKIPGEGYSTPIVWRDRIFLLAAIPQDTGNARAAETAPVPAPDAPARPPGGGKRGGGKGGGPGRGGFGGGPAPAALYEFVVLALDRRTGQIVWQKTARKEKPHEGHHPTNTYASASPTTDGEHLYVPFGSRGFYCYDLQGNLKWEKDLGDMQSKMSFGEGASPSLAGDLLIIHWDHEGGSFITALNKRTGAEVWRKNRDEGTSWSTPLIVEHEGKLQAIVAAANMTRSYDAKSGEVLWEASGLTKNIIPTPVTGHGLVYVTSGFQGYSTQAIKLSARGDVSDSKDIVWKIRQSSPYVSSPVLSGDRLYLIKGLESRLSCVNALTGEFHFQDQPLTGMRQIYASALAANGNLYVVDREGTVMVVKDAAKFEVISTNKLGEKIDASPVALDNELFLRGHEHLYCIAEGAKGT